MGQQSDRGKLRTFMRVSLFEWSSYDPCGLCAGALINARVRTLVFGAADLKAGATGSLYNVCTDPRMNHNPTVNNGVMAPESQTQLQEFFARKRDK